MYIIYIFVCVCVCVCVCACVCVCVRACVYDNYFLIVFILRCFNLFVVNSFCKK